MDWKSLELAGVASKELKQAFIDVAIAQGKIKEGEVTVANFNQTLSKKWADQQVMEGAFGKFAEMTMEAKRLIDAGVYRNATEAYKALASKYGEVAVKAAQSAQEAKSFKEAIEATQDAVSSGWLTTFEHIFGNYEEAKKLWTNLTDVLWEVFAAGAEMRNEVLEKWHNAKTGGYQTLMDALDNLFEVITRLANLTRGGLLKVILGNKAEDVHALEMILVKATRAFRFFTDDLLKFTNNLERFQVIEKVFTGLHAIFVALKVPVSLLSQAFHEAFDPLFTYNGNKLKWSRDLAIILSQIATKFRDMAIGFNNWIRSTYVVQDLSAIVRGIASAFDIVRLAAEAFIRKLRESGMDFTRPFKRLLLDLANIGNYITKLRNNLRDSGAFDRIMTTVVKGLKAVSSVLEVVMYAVRTIVSAIGDGIYKLAPAGSNLLDIFDKVFDWIIKFSTDILEDSAFDSFGSVLETIFGIIGKGISFLTSGSPLEWISNALKKVFEWAGKAFGAIKDGLSGMGSGGVLKTGGALGILALLGKRIYDVFTNKDLFGTFKKWVKGLGKSITGIFDELGGAAKAFANSQNAKALKDVALSIALLAGSLLVISLIKPASLVKAMTAIGVGLAAMVGTLYLLNTLQIKKGVATELLKVAGSIFLMSLAIGAVAVATLIFAVALKILATIDPKKMWTAIGGLAATLAAVAGVLFLLAKFSKGGKLLAAGAAIMMVAAGIMAIALSLAVLALIPKEALDKGVVAIAEVLVMLVVALLAVSLSGGKAVAAAAGLMILSAALIAIAAALVILSFVPYDKLIGGVKAIALTLLAMVGALLLLSLAKGWAVVAGVAMLLLGGALLLISFAMLNAAKAFRNFGAALPIVSFGFKTFEGLSWEAIGKGFAVILGSIASLLLLSFATLRDGTDALAGFGFALPGIANGFKAMEGVAWDAIGKAFAILAESIVGLFFLQPATIFDGTDALAHLGEALPGLATGFQAFADVDSEAVGLAGKAMAEAILALLGLEIATLIKDGTPALVNLSNALPGLATGFQSFTEIDPTMLSNVGQAMSVAIKTLLGVGLSSIIDGTPALMNLSMALPKLAVGFRAFEGMDPEWIVQIAQGLSRGIDALTGDFIGNLFKSPPDFVGLANGIMQLSFAVLAVPADSEARLAGIANGLQAVIAVSVESVATVQTDMMTIQATIEVTLVYIVTTVESHLSKLAEDFSICTATIVTLVDQSMASMVTSVSSAVEPMYNLGASIGQNLADGLRSKIDEVRMAAAELELAAGRYSAMVSRRTQAFGYGGAGTNFTEMYKRTGKSVGEMFGSGVASGASSALGIHSPSKVFEQFGMYTSLGFANGLTEGGPDVRDGFSSVINPMLLAISALLDSDMDLSPSITPVVDLSNVSDAAGAIQDYLANGSELTGRLAYDAGLQTSRVAQNRSADSVESQFANGDSMAVGNGIIVNVYPSAGMDEKALADKVIYRLTDKLGRRRAATE